MRIVIAGGHGKIARRLERLLTVRGDQAVGLIRNPAHADDLRDVGAEPLVCDLEQAGVDEVCGLLCGADAAVFAAGAGPGSGAVRKDTMDRAGAVLFADAAQRAGVRRLVVVSAMRTDQEPPPDMDPAFAAYLRAKSAADADIRAREGLDWTILRPGRLTDTPGTGLVELARDTGRADVTRDDVAAVLLALLDEPRTAGMTLELVGGTVDVNEAVTALVT